MDNFVNSLGGGGGMRENGANESAAGEGRARADGVERKRGKVRPVRGGKRGRWLRGGVVRGEVARKE